MTITAVESDNSSIALENKPKLRRYLLVVLAISACMYLAALFVVRLPSFERWGGSFYGPVLDYGFESAGVDADVVIFGDSSALYDISPVQMSNALGVKVINLPNTLGSLPVTEDMALRQYLSTNKKPRLIIFYFTVWSLDYDRDSPSSLIYEGEEMLARHGSMRQIVSFARKDPTAPLLFPFRFYSASPKAAVLSMIRRQDRVSAVRASFGHLEPDFKRSPLPRSCVVPETLIRRDNVESAEALLTRYKSRGVPVLFYIAPVPDCADMGPVVGRSYAALDARPPQRMEAPEFWDDGFYAHVIPAAVPRVTDGLVEATRAALGDRAPR